MQDEGIHQDLETMYDTKIEEESLFTKVMDSIKNFFTGSKRRHGRRQRRSMKYGRERLSPYSRRLIRD
jgi:hypothetical protein